MKKLIIFDLDGTLLNTIEDITNSINEVLKFYNHQTKTADEVMYFLGRGPKALLEDCFNKKLEDEEYADIYELYDKRYTINQKIHTRPYDGINELLKELKKDYKLAVCSNKQHNLTVSLISEVFPNTFDFIVGTGKVERKPSPMMVNLAMKEFNVTKDETLFIGDTETDINTGINAGVDVVAVLWGFRTKEDLKSLNPKYYVNKPKEILTILNNSKEK